MFTELKDFPYNKAKESSNNQASYAYMLSRIKGVEDSEGCSSYRDHVCGLIRSEVFFISTLNHDLKRIPTNILKKRFNMMKTVIKHISGLTYREYLESFPISIELDGRYCSLYSDVMDAFIAQTYETLGECGIDFDFIDIDDIVGDNKECFSDIIGNIHNDVLLGFWCTLNNTLEMLLKRDTELQSKHCYDELRYNPEVLL